MPSVGVPSLIPAASFGSQPVPFHPQPSMTGLPPMTSINVSANRMGAPSHCGSRTTTAVTWAPHSVVPSLVGSHTMSPTFHRSEPHVTTAFDVPPPATNAARLPKLALRKLDGDLTKWVRFWDSFESSIHSNRALSDIDKFNYLNSLLKLTAAESVAGLMLTSANYAEAIATLKRRFGNTQLIVSRHMDALLGLSAVASHNNLKALRSLYDTVETHVRGLRALNVHAESYGGLLTSILMSKLPTEIRLIVSRELTEDKWEVGKIIERD